MDADVQAATAELLDAKPELEANLRTLVRIDRDGSWQFDDIPLESGAFGELVEMGIATRTDDGYRLADRAAVEAALAGDSVDSADGSSRSHLLDVVSLDYSRIIVAAAALAFVAVVRVAPMISSTFRDGRIVLASNDPYMYRAAAEKLFASNLAAFDFGALAQLTLPLTGTPIRLHDTLMVVFAWWGSALLGGDAAVGTLLAWYPPAVGVLTALGVLVVTTRVSGDYRAGLAATVLLAVTPAHAFRTALGFGDHHAFDYLWLTVTLFAVVVVAGTRHDRRSWLRSRPIQLAFIGGGLAITAQLAAWRGSPLYLVPIALYAFARSLLDLNRDSDPIAGSAPLVAMLAVGTVATVAVHLAFGWLQPYRVIAPALVLAGTLVVVVVATVAWRRNIDVRTVLVVDGVGGAVAATLAWVAIPTVSSALGEFVGYLSRYGASGIAETQSLFAGNLGSIAAPLLLFGFVFFLGLPYVIWASYHTMVGDGDPSLLVVAAYALVFTLLAIVQIRFAGQLALCIVPFAGIGFIHLADRTGIIEAPELLASDTTPSLRDGGERYTVTFPSVRTVAYLLVLFLLVGGLGAIQTPIKMGQVAIDDDTAATGTWVAAHASSDAKETNPYVLTQWSRSRATNFLAGGSYRTYEDYGYALDTCEGFLTARSSDGWYDRLSGDGVAYVVIDRSWTENLPAETVGARLSRQYGSAAGEVDGLGHYRAMYEINDRVVFAVVPGARLTGSAEPNATVTIETTVELNGRSVTYTRKVEANETGAYAVTVPYSGVYSVAGSPVDVSESAVQNGTSVQVST